MPSTSPNEIESFLERCRKVIGTSFILRWTPKNKKTIQALGFTHKNVVDEICSLSGENYSEGPTQDHHSSDEIWIFGKLIEQREIYIKLQLSKYNDPGELTETLYCISFHFAERCLKYPYKK